MNRYLMIHRLRWPAVLLLTGVIALLDQADVLSWGRAWPLYLILFGILALAERAAGSSQLPPSAYPYADPYAGGYPPQTGYAPQPGYAPQAGYQPIYGTNYAPAAAPAATPRETGIVPASGTPGLNTQIGSNREEEER